MCDRSTAAGTTDQFRKMALEEWTQKLFLLAGALFRVGLSVKRTIPSCLTALSTKTSPNRSIRFAILQANTACHHRRNYLFLWPTISPRSVRRSTRVRFFSIAGVSSEMCGMSQRYSAMNQIGFSAVIQFR
jgi:hypothetical protein